MSATALLVDDGTTTPCGSAERTETSGVVAVHLLGLGNTTATCSCGWTGRRRLLRAAAELDAWTHSAQDGCDVSSPLVFAW